MSDKHADMHIKAAQLHAVLSLMQKDDAGMPNDAGWALWVCLDLAEEVKVMADELYAQSNREETKGEVCHG